MCRLELCCIVYTTVLLASAVFVESKTSPVKNGFQDCSKDAFPENNIEGRVEKDFVEIKVKGVKQLAVCTILTLLRGRYLGIWEKEIRGENHLSYLSVNRVLVFIYSFSLLFPSPKYHGSERPLPY